MAKYKVIHPFRDLQDKGKTSPSGRVYKVGDPFPATQRDVSEERITELKGKRNKIGERLIAVDTSDDENKKTTIEDLTKKEIQEAFDKNGIDYNKSDTKAELINRVEGD